MHLALVLLCTLGVAFSAIDPAPSTLKYVVAAWRHGDRNPTGTFPNDPNQEDTWLRGWGALTKVGMREAFDLGRMFRDRYIGSYMNKVYDPKEIYVAGDQVDRTLQTGQAVMNGLYPPTPDVNFVEGTTWFPFPLHERDDPAMFIFGNCPTAVQLYEAFIQSDEGVKMTNQEHKEFLDFVREKTGAPLKNGAPDILSPFSAIVSEAVHKDTNPPPDWVTPEVFNKMNGLFNKAFDYFFATRELQKARIGLMVGEINARLQKAANGTVGTPSKFYGYSVHDHNVLALRKAYKVFDGVAPPYTAACIFELHERGGQNYVEMYYKDSLTYEGGEFKKQVMPCDPCTLEDFVKVTADDVAVSNIDEYRQVCGLPPVCPTK